MHIRLSSLYAGQHVRYVAYFTGQRVWSATIAVHNYRPRLCGLAACVRQLSLGCVHLNRSAAFDGLAQLAVRLGEGKIIAPQAFAVEEGGHDRLQMELRHQIENACSADRFAIFVWPWPLRSGQFKCA